MKRGQVWVETALYTLIGLTLIGLVLGFVNPKINESKDRLLVEQTIGSLNSLDERINIIEGNVRIVDFSIRKGDLYINSLNDSITFSLNELTKPYSEPGSSIRLGRVELYSEEGKKYSSANLTLNYKGIFNITYEGEDVNVVLNSAPLPYKFAISNVGGDGEIDSINIEEIS